MAKDERLYARFDIGMDEHPKIMLLSDAAFRALVEGTFYSRRQNTDGFIDARVALKKWGHDSLSELAENHAERPSLVAVEGGYQIRDYAEHQITRADIEVKREAGRKGGLAKAQRAASKPVAPATNLPQQNPSKASTTALANGYETLAMRERELEKELETEKTTTDVVAKEPRVNLPSIFDAAYDHWPKKVKRDEAYSRFVQAVKVIPPESLAERIQRFGIAYEATTEKKYIPALGPWLYQKRWTDELPSSDAVSQLSSRSQTGLATLQYYADEQNESQRGIEQ